VIGIFGLLVAPVVFGAVLVRRGHPRRSVAVAVAGWFGAVAAVMALLLVQWLFTDEGDLPPDDLSGRLPAGLEVVAQDKQCGSGGCWRQYTVRDSGDAKVDAVAGKLRVSGLEGCRHSLWIPDLRRRCTHISTTSTAVLVSVNVEGW